jgi:ribosomal protein S18 acetylase RimI-like enzyme
MVTVRRAVPEDAAALAELATRTFRDAYADNTDPDDMASHLSSRYSERLQHQEICNPSVEVLLAEHEGRLIAYAMIRDGEFPSCITEPSPIELWRFYVDAPWHGRGVAQTLMAAVKDAARRREARTVWLGVWEHNPKAQAFYRKCGFRVIGTQICVIGADAQTDIVMAHELTSA